MSSRKASRPNFNAKFCFGRAVATARAFCSARRPQATSSVIAGLGDRIEHAPTLLVVDDEPVIRASLADALQEAGFNVIDSPTGEQALEELATPGIAGIVTDIRLGAGLN